MIGGLILLAVVSALLLALAALLPCPWIAFEIAAHMGGHRSPRLFAACGSSITGVLLVLPAFLVVAGLLAEISWWVGAALALLLAWSPGAIGGWALGRWHAAR